MRHAILAAVAALSGLVAASQPSFASGPGSFTIRSLSFAGSGCPAGSVASNVSSDLQAFTLLFDRYAAQVGPGIPFSESRKNCQLAISFDCPAGWQFALMTLDSRGYAALDSGVNGLQKTAFYFQGSAQTASVQRPFAGPLSDDYQVRDVIPVPNRLWGHCGASSRALNINTQVRLTSSDPSAQGLMTVDSIDGEVHQTWGIVWQRETP